MEQDEKGGDVWRRRSMQASGGAAQNQEARDSESRVSVGDRESGEMFFFFESNNSKQYRIDLFLI